MADRIDLRRVVVALESGRDVDVNILLQRELSPIPLSLATSDGKLRYASSKAELSNILQNNESQSQVPINLDKTCCIIDAMAAVQSLANRSGAKTFSEWCDNFLKYIVSKFSASCTRVDVVFDRYLDNSIKGGTRAKREGGTRAKREGGTRAKREGGKKSGIRRNVEKREQKIGKWERFIVVGENKASLANFLSTEITQSFCLHPTRELVLSGGFSDILQVWSSDDTKDLSRLASNHEEANTRIVLHARDATLHGYQQINVVCRDTDVLVLLLAHRELLCPVIWMFSGTTKRKRHIPVHSISLSEEKRKSLLAFHAITGCDTVSQFAGIGKKTAWKIFETHHHLLQHLGDGLPEKEVLAEVEAFVCKLYNKNTSEVEINKERAAAFRKTKKSLDSLPPTQDSLNLHSMRANYQTLVWKKALEPCHTLPPPEECGWQHDEGTLRPRLMTQEQVSAACLQLAFCGCTREGNCCANRRCTCVRLSLSCTNACKCGDFCRNTRNAVTREDE